MPGNPESVHDLIASGGLGHLVTLNSDGSAQVSCVWIGTDSDELITAHLRDHRKVRNVRRHPQVVVSIESDQMIQHGPWLLKKYVVIYGKARLEEGGAAEWLRDLSRIYIGPDVDTQHLDNAPPGYVLRVTPERYTGVGPWARGRE